MWPILENIPCSLEKMVKFIVLGWNVLYISVRSNWYIVSFKVCVVLLIFCLVDLSIGVGGVLKFPTIIVLLLISPSYLLAFVLHIAVLLCWVHISTDDFELWCWRRLLRVPWTARRSNQSILKEISPEYFLEGLMLKLKLQYFGHLMQSTDSLEKILVLGKIEGGREGEDRGWDGWMASPTQWTWVWVNSGCWWWTGGLVCYSPWGQKESDVTECLNWTDMGKKIFQITCLFIIYQCLYHFSSFVWKIILNFLTVSGIVLSTWI